MADNYYYTLTFVSKDRPGIVADVTKVLYERGFNIADSSSTLLQGIFSMILIVEHSNGMTEEEISAFFPSDSYRLSLYKLPGAPAQKDAGKERYVISVYGADKPGIVHTITAKLYEQSINIVDLQTQATGTPPKETYIMILEVEIPDNLDQNWIEHLKKRAAEIGTDITIRHLEVYEL